MRWRMQSPTPALAASIPASTVPPDRRRSPQVGRVDRPAVAGPKGAEMSRRRVVVDVGPADGCR